jgi:diguanylate cyclase (GGDEF)-like protein
MIDDPPLLDDKGAIVAVSADWYDESTGLPGPAFWRTILGAESARCARYRRPATVVLAQVVGFADVARLWGRDVALQGVVDVVAVLRSGCRASDYVTRLAEDRVGMILTETDEIAAINMVERVRDRCDRALKARAVGGRTVFGWAGPTASLSLLDAVGRAEELLRLEAGTDWPNV